MDVSFVEHKPFFNQTHLQGESEKEDGKFWETTPVLPNSFFPIETESVFSGTEINNREFVFQKETESENIE